MSFYVTPTDEMRLKQWEKVYGRTHLPVKYPQPHLACTQRWGETWVYYLDTTAVPPALLDRLAVFEARRLGIAYRQARLAVRQEWLIPADGCQLEQLPAPQATVGQRAFDFLRTVPQQLPPQKLRPRPFSARHTH